MGYKVLTAAWDIKCWRRSGIQCIDCGVGCQLLIAAVDTKYWLRRGIQCIDWGVGYKVLTAALDTKFWLQRGIQSYDCSEGCKFLTAAREQGRRGIWMGQRGISYECSLHRAFFVELKNIHYYYSRNLYLKISLKNIGVFYPWFHFIFSFLPKMFSFLFNNKNCNVIEKMK